MTMGKCRECGREVSTGAAACPGCGVKSPTASSGARLFALVGVFVSLFVVYRCATASDRTASAAAVPQPAEPNAVVAAVVDRGLDPIYAKVSADAVAQYGIAKRNGSPMDACVNAGMVAAAFLQAKDETSYRTWKATEQADCAAAGAQEPAPQPTPKAEPKAADVSKLYRVKSDKVMATFKRTIDVELFKHESEATLSAICHLLKAANPAPVERTFINFDVRGEPKPPQMSNWAIARFDPELSVRILGDE